jgi:HD-GYP domain-containing protein (c-di-GMP phosphodiesterase class II)
MLADAVFGQGLAGQVALGQVRIHIPDLSQTDPYYLHPAILSNEKFVSYVGVPFISKGLVRGVLEVFNRSAFEPDDDWFSLLDALASQAANAIENASVLVELQQSSRELALAYEATIDGWSRALEMRDGEMEGHTQRITQLTVRLARLSGIDEKEIVHVRRGALLHDIGKMGLPDSILLISGPLTNDEIEIMQQHPVYAMKMLSTIPHLRPALDIPVYHHEKWDGTGYPYRLVGEQIPLAARIFAIADIYDALTSDHPHRKAWTHKDAISYIRKQAGFHFDPALVPFALRELGANPPSQK